ncbi:MAG: mechanosensitive ion channel [Firmicutes bacterium]|nr:mechanosensitive ion channel [Bacillota bacterium]
MDKTILTAIIVAAASFVMQKTLNNIIYGFVIWFTRPFKKGDKVTIKQLSHVIASGNVIRRGILHISIKDYNRNVIIIPNSIMESCTVINSDYNSGVNYINSVKLDFNSDIDKAKSIIKEAIMSHPLSENTEENTHIICKTEVGGMVLEYNVRTSDTNTSFDVCSDIMETLVKKFQKVDDITLV